MKVTKEVIVLGFQKWDILVTSPHKLWAWKSDSSGDKLKYSHTSVFDGTSVHS